jgi:hypothetical protein
MCGFSENSVAVTAVLGLSLAWAHYASLPTLAADKIGMETIIANLKANERLYDNRSVRWRRSYRYLEARPMIAKSKNMESFHPIANSEEEGFCVAQNGKFFLENKGNVSSYGSEKGTMNQKLHVRKAFDGEQTRHLELAGPYVGNIYQGPAYDGRMFNPYVLPIQLRLAIPLSTYLSGTAAIRADPRAVDFHTGSQQYSASYDRDEKVAGLRCHRITETVTTTDPVGDSEVSARSKWWLAIDRNYLPVKNECCLDFYSKDIPIQSCELGDLREIAPGVWFPFTAKLTLMQQVALLEHKKAIVAGVTEWVVSEVSLKPQYESSFFRDVKFPDGTLVYEMAADKKVIRSYVQGGKRIGAGGK